MIQFVNAIDNIPTPTSAQINAFIEVQDLAEQQLKTISYDVRGQISSTKEFNQISDSGTGVLNAQTIVEDFVYDAFGQILLHSKGQGENKNVTNFTYDGLGRELSKTNSSGHVTTTLYQDNESKIIISYENGLRLTQVYDNYRRMVSSISESVNDLGNVEQSQTTNYIYNNDGLLRATINPDSSISYVFYNNIGQKSADVSETGQVVEYIYDNRGNQVKQVQYATLISTQTWLLNSSVIKSTISEIRPETSSKIE